MLKWCNMASYTYLRKKRGERVARASKGGAARFEKYKTMHDPIIVGGFKTFGSLGDHTVEILDFGDPSKVWIRVDGGGLRQPRTSGGVVRILGEWLWRKRNA